MKKDTEKAYAEIFDLLDSYKDVITFDIPSLIEMSKRHIFALELNETYGLNISPTDVYSTVWIRCGDYIRIGWWGEEKHNRYISWSDDGTQPVDELLLEISFPTGAYIFGNSFDDDYPKDLFYAFWLELKEFGPKYIDSHNHNMYFTMDNAAAVFNNFRTILNKYKEINKKDSKERKIKKLQSELDKLNMTK